MFSKKKVNKLNHGHIKPNFTHNTLNDDYRYRQNTKNN